MAPAAGDDGGVARNCSKGVFNVRKMVTGSLSALASWPLAMVSLRMYSVFVEMKGRYCWTRVLKGRSAGIWARVVAVVASRRVRDRCMVEEVGNHCGDLVCGGCTTETSKLNIHQS